MREIFLTIAKNPGENCYIQKKRKINTGWLRLLTQIYYTNFISYILQIMSSIIIALDTKFVAAEVMTVPDSAAVLYSPPPIFLGGRGRKTLRFAKSLPR